MNDDFTINNKSVRIFVQIAIYMLIFIEIDVQFQKLNVNLSYVIISKTIQV